MTVANTSSAELGDAPPTTGALGEFAAIEQREQGRVDPSGVVADGPHGCTDAIMLARQHQLVRAANSSNRSGSRAHRDLAATELSAEHRQQVALVGLEIDVGQRATVRTQTSQPLAAA
jgi:hypothetical protein